ncbi:uncharacterized protein LOC111235612 [Seriola dumerili]|uniref:uncharacterized protein LOC111235612 n=1 Tax=Seriola dumerili TaxID=41447 RepID=UPI000BBE7B39|nr:uncharacterized protein LOC111235612 [Seriola dumerili]
MGRPSLHTCINEPLAPTTLSPVHQLSFLGRLSAGWRFYWYKTVPDGSQHSYNYELLPGSSSGTRRDSYIVHGWRFYWYKAVPDVTDNANYDYGYDQIIFTTWSDIHDPYSYELLPGSSSGTEQDSYIVHDVHPSASLTVIPDRVQHFTYDSVFVSCEGTSAEWRVRGIIDDGSLSSCSDWRMLNRSTFKIETYNPSNAVYWCESESGEFSNAVNITVHDKGVILVSPAHPVTEGGSVTLGCKLQKLKRAQYPSRVVFYHNDKIVQDDIRVKLNITAVSKSDEGFYRCEYSGEKSPQSWISVRSAGGDVCICESDRPKT